MSKQLAMFPAASSIRPRVPPAPIVRAARVEGTCRFTLERAWWSGKRIGIVGCNPSRADAEKDDPTMLREMAFAWGWGFGSLVKLNVYPVIASTIDELRRWPGYRIDFGRQREEPEGRAWIENGIASARALAGCSALWAAWGRDVDPNDLALWLKGLQELMGLAEPVRWHCLGTNADGSPRHTLARGRHRIPDDASLVPWQPR
jgi:hypothetical protein